jgi:hypothetical protein
MEADNSRETTTAEKQTISGMPTLPGMLEAPVAEETSAALGKAATAEEGIHGRNNCGMYEHINSRSNRRPDSSTRQETTGAAGDANTTAEGIPKLMDTSGEEEILTTVGTPQQELQGG